MKQEQSIIIKKQLSEIVDILILNGTLTECPGLIHGKIGLSIFFFNYAKHNHDTLFSNYAIELINETQNQIHINSSADYERGIAGIGIGINYLIQNSFLAADNDIYDDLDQRMKRAVLYEPWQDFSLYNGLVGYGRYWISRLKHPQSSLLAQECLLHIIKLIKAKWESVSIEEQVDIYYFLYSLPKLYIFNPYIESIMEKLYNLVKINHSHHQTNSFVGKLASTFQYNNYNDILKPEENNIAEHLLNWNIEKSYQETGILLGYAGEGLLRLSIIGQTDLSWLSLL